MDKEVIIKANQARKQMKGPRMFDENLLRQAGIDPNTLMPMKLCSGDPQLRRDTRVLLRVLDEQDAVNRYEWGIPKGLALTSQELERLIYYKGNLVFFEFRNQFFVMPYALEGGLDFYGRFKVIHPVPMTAGTDEEPKPEDGEKYKRYKALEAILSSIQLKVCYVPLGKDVIEGEFTKIKKDESEIHEDSPYGVLLYDYTKQWNQLNLSRQQINEPLLSFEAKVLPFLNTAMINGTGIRGVRVNDGDEYQNVLIGCRSLEYCAMNGMVWNPVTGPVEFQDFANGGSGVKMMDFMQIFQSLENFRMKLYGINNGGLFQKKAHELEQEEKMKEADTTSPMEDGLKIRKHFCDIVNSIWNCGITVKQKQIVSQEDSTDSNPEQKREDGEGGNE